VNMKAEPGTVQPAAIASIMIVDDQPENLQLLVELLIREGYQVRPAISGRAALEAAELKCPDLLLLDINMPDLNGYEVCRRFKSNPATRNIPVIFLSSLENTVDKLKAFEIGGVDYISKPFRGEEVLARIRNHLQLHRVQQQLQQEIDIRKAIQEELEKHQDQLGKLVFQRTAELEKTNLELKEEIQQRANTEEQLRGSQERYMRLYIQFESLLDAISDPIAVLTADLKLIWVNKAYRRLRDDLGADEQGLVFRRYFVEGVISPVLECLETGKPAEQQLTTPDQRIWGYRAYPLRQGDGIEQQVITIATDFSEKVRLREEAGRVSRLAALGELAAGVAHEINNPNALILYNSDLLQAVLKDLLPGIEGVRLRKGEQLFGGLSFTEARKEIPDLLASILGGSQRIKRIVDDLRNFSHVEEGLQQEVVNCNQVVEASLRQVGNAIGQKTDHLILELNSDLPRIIGNSGRLEQVVVNLLLNAGQALESREEQIRVRTYYDQEAEQVVLQVADQGRGIAPELLERLSEPFFTTRRDQGGTGLGLSVSSRIVREHGGELSFVSEPGDGATVTLRLPIINEENIRHG